MSLQLISRSPDLARLRDEGYEVSIRHGHLVMTGVPYATADRKVRLGTLISDLSLAGDQTTRPANHVAFFAGEYPCDAQGRRIKQISHQSARTAIAADLTYDHAFSSKPREGYRDYHHKMTAYAAILVSQAQAIDPDVTAQTHRVVESEDPDSPFVYVDSASGRAGISAVTAKLRLKRVGVFGLGGSGAYILDQLAKLPIAEIPIFDGDTFLQHNAFRAPGAASVEQLRELPKKVHYYRDLYSAMHRNIVPYPFFIDAQNAGEAGDFDFAFISMDSGDAKRALVEHLEARDVPFIDVGMGVELVGDSLLGLLRVTLSTPAKREHVRDNQRISFAETGADALYAKNIQIADLNALNAMLAIIKFKKHFGFYVDLEREHFSAYAIDGNHLTNEDQG